MYKDVSIGQLCEPPMLTVGVGEVKDVNSVGQYVFLHPYNGLCIDSSHQSNSLYPYLAAINCQGVVDFIKPFIPIIHIDPIPMLPLE